jgi:hypothetical protein
MTVREAIDSPSHAELGPDPSLLLVLENDLPRWGDSIPVPSTDCAHTGDKDSAYIQWGSVQHVHIVITTWGLVKVRGKQIKGL